MMPPFAKPWAAIYTPKVPVGASPRTGECNPSWRIGIGTTSSGRLPEWPLVLIAVR